MKLHRKADFGIGVFFLVFCAALFILADQLPASKMMAVGPDFMPKVYAGIGVLLSVILILSSFRSQAVDECAEGGENLPLSEYRLVLFSFLLLVLYVLLLDVVGFLLMTIFYLFFQMMVLSPRSKRKPVLFILLAALSSVIIFYVFRRAFAIQLPLGILPFIS